MKMQIVNRIEQFNQGKGSAITVGKFDGLHLGHQLLIKNIVDKEGLIPLLFTFSNSPRSVLQDEKEAFIITSDERACLAEKFGIEIFAEFPFDEKMMHLSRDEFLDMLINSFNMKCLCVGSDFRFGYKGQGNVDYLIEASKQKGFELVVCPKLFDGDVEISSTYIRELLLKGELQHVNRLLGHDYSISGKVIHGNHLGRTIGIPTINVLPEEAKLLPPFGVYASKVLVDGKEYFSVTNIGVKPTVSTDNIVCTESHILDAKGDFYGKEVTIKLMEMLRPEMKFSGVDELKEQMASDAKRARRILCNLE